ncbi:ATP-binding protein [Candidatus Saccharibacteria bacterium]|nr:ATP-binding protein [Candidatus Saccharibacteria bacterium]
MKQKSKAHLIMIYGVAGSGKSFFARKFVEVFRAAYLDVNGLRYDIFPKPQFDEEEGRAVRHVGICVLKNLLLGGQTTVLEGGIDTKKERDEIRKLAEEAGYNTMLLWVQTDEITAKKRIAERKTEKMTRRQFEEVVERTEAPKAKEGAIVISGKHTFQTQMKVALGQLSGR